MSFWSKLFGGSKTAETVSETLRDSAKSTFSIIDNAFYTDQEKAEASKQAMDAYIEVYKTTMNESTGTAEARRWFLQVVTNYVLLAATIAIGSTVLGYPEIAKAITEVVTAFQIGWAFVSAVSFYFLTHVAKGLRK